MLIRKVKREKEREGNSNVLYYYNYYRQNKARCDKAIFRHVRRNKLGKRIKKKKESEERGGAKENSRGGEMLIKKKKTATNNIRRSVFTDKKSLKSIHFVSDPFMHIRVSLFLASDPQLGSVDI